MALDSLFDQFIRERIYVKNVTPKTRLGGEERLGEALRFRRTRWTRRSLI